MTGRARRGLLGGGLGHPGFGGLGADHMSVLSVTIQLYIVFQ